jgi:hypothetical protein
MRALFTNDRARADSKKRPHFFEIVRAGEIGRGNRKRASLFVMRRNFGLSEAEIVPAQR